MLKYAKTSNIDLTAKDENGRTGFQIAERSGKTNIVEVIRKKMPNIAI